MFGKNKRTYEDGLRERARELRATGLTYSEICEVLGVEIPKSTLNHWVSNVLLTPEQQQRILEKDREAAAQGREGGLWGGAAGFNKEMKNRRIEAAREQAAPVVKRLAQDREALMLMASALYMGEGAKDEKQFSIGNSDPRIIQAWLSILREAFSIDESKFRCQLMLTEGMDEETLKVYWSGVTGIPASRFYKSSFRKDSGGRKREGYKGVCVVNYHSLETRRLLDAIGQGVIDELLDKGIE
jgi:transcriptional regulator with XRE-family HTH domain